MALVAKLYENREEALKVNDGVSIRRRCKELFDPLHKKRLERRANEIMTLSEGLAKPFEKLNMKQKLALLS